LAAYRCLDTIASVPALPKEKSYLPVYGPKRKKNETDDAEDRILLVLALAITDVSQFSRSEIEATPLEKSSPKGRRWVGRCKNAIIMLSHSFENTEV